MAVEYYFAGGERKTLLTVRSLCDGKRTLEDIQAAARELLGFEPLNPVPDSKLDHLLSPNRNPDLTVVAVNDDGTVSRV